MRLNRTTKELRSTPETILGDQLCRLADLMSPWLSSVHLLDKNNEALCMSPDLSLDPDETDKKEKPFCVLVALNRNSSPTLNDITSKLRKLFPKVAPAQDLVEEEVGIGFVLDGSIVVIMTRSGAIPLEASLDPTVRKPLSIAILESQQAHLVIAVRDCAPARAAMTATRVAAAILECCSHAIAVYWPAARQWVAPRAVVDQAVRDVHVRPLVQLWVDCRVWPVAGKGHAGFTRGMQSLGHKEFEVRSSPESAKDLLERLEGLCSYVLMHGPVIRDGHTVGHSEDERISILLCRSVHGLQDTVLRLDYDEDFKPRRPWWKLI